MNKEYIGDSVYVEPGCYCGEIVLTTNNGYHDDPRNTIVLGPSEFANLLRWHQAWMERIKMQQADEQEPLSPEDERRELEAKLADRDYDDFVARETQP